MTSASTEVLAVARKSWPKLDSRKAFAAALFAGAVAESIAYVIFQRRAKQLDEEPFRRICEDIDLDGHSDWLEKRLREKNVADGFVSAMFCGAHPAEISKRSAILAMAAYLTVRPPQDFEGSEYPEITRDQARRVVGCIEAMFPQSFPLDASRKPLNFNIKELDPLLPKMCTGFKPLAPIYHPLGLRATVQSAHFVKDLALRFAGFRRTEVPGRHGVFLWMRPPRSPQKAEVEGAAQLPPLIFLHGLGWGLTQYSLFLTTQMPSDRLCLVPEFPLISQRWAAAGHDGRFPTPIEFAQILVQIMDDFNSPMADIFAHSYGTAILTFLRRRFPDRCRQMVYVDPVCFVPKLAQWLMFGYEPYLESTKSLLRYTKDQLGEGISMGPLGLFRSIEKILATYLVKVFVHGLEA
ncbi:Heme oxygenase 1 [Cymbomonas tetramitiformis]|uniref:Heme oxygenase 1 n=1 Tax=Cymbomonas tetramitiformis TaxID=36881 RepID=A0AAE0KT58_9CHLO|nr:Heme oxygenase 1 [Cymbomonas tetramitiformis]